MKPTFWIRRFLAVFTGVFLLLFVIYVLRSRNPTAAATESSANRATGDAGIIPRDRPGPLPDASP